MVLVKYAIRVTMGESEGWIAEFGEVRNEHTACYFFNEDFKNAHLFDYLQTASFLCDLLNEQTDGFVYKVCSVNIIIDED